MVLKVKLLSDSWQLEQALVWKIYFQGILVLYLGSFQELFIYK